MDSTEFQQGRGRSAVGRSGVEIRPGGEEETFPVGGPRQEVVGEYVHQRAALARLDVEDHVAALRHQHQLLPVRRPRHVADQVDPPKPDASPSAVRGLEDVRDGAARAGVIHHERLRPVPSPEDVRAFWRKIHWDSAPAASIGPYGVDRLAPAPVALKDDCPRGVTPTSTPRCERRREGHRQQAGAYHSRTVEPATGGHSPGAALSGRVRRPGRRRWASR